MRAVIQRVLRSSVVIDGETVVIFEHLFKFHNILLDFYSL